MVSTGTLLTVLSNIPWGQVVDNAPKIADGASRLWGAVKARRGRPEGAAPGAEAGEDAAAPGAGAGADPAEPGAEPADAAARAEALTKRLAGQVAALEAVVDELQGQLQASSGLVKDLAEQNAQLVQRLEMQQQQLAAQQEQLAVQQQQIAAQQRRLHRLMAGGAVLALLLAGLSAALWWRGG